MRVLLRIYEAMAPMLITYALHLCGLITPLATCFLVVLVGFHALIGESRERVIIASDALIAALEAYLKDVKKHYKVALDEIGRQATELDDYEDRNSFDVEILRTAEEWIDTLGKVCIKEGHEAESEAKKYNLVQAVRAKREALK